MHVFLCLSCLTPSSQTDTSNIFLKYQTKSLLQLIFVANFLLQVASWAHILTICFFLKCPCWMFALSSDGHIFSTRDSLLIINPLCFTGVFVSFSSIFWHQSLWSLSPEMYMWHIKRQAQQKSTTPVSPSRHLQKKSPVWSPETWITMLIR